MNNKEKNEKYKDLMSKMKKAINCEFYYEAILLEYAILEDRTESLIRHADLDISNISFKDLTLHKKLNKIKNNKIFKSDYITKHIDEKMIKEILEWKERRNKIIHDLIKIDYSNETIKQIALEGYEIVKKVNNKSTLVNQYLDKNQELVS